MSYIPPYAPSLADWQRTVSREFNALSVNNGYIVNIVDYGALSDASANGATGTDDSAAVQRAIDVLAAAGGGTLLVPRHTKCASPLNFAGLDNIRLIGPAGPGAGYGIAPPAQLIYTGTGPRFLDFRSTTSCEISGLGVRYTSASFTGDLIDFSHDGSARDACYFLVERCLVGGLGAYTARRCINLLDAILGTIRDCHISCAVVGIGGKLESSPGYSNAHLIDGNTFDNLTTSAILNAGEAWTVIGNRFEGTNDGTSGGMPRAFWDDFTAGADNVIPGLYWAGNWHGDDVNVADAWFGNNHAFLRGCAIHGGYFGNQFGTGKSIVIGRTCSGLSISGANIDSIDLGSIGHFGISITGNYLENEVANLTSDSRDIFIAGNALAGSLTSKSIIRMADPYEFGFGDQAGVTVTQLTSRTTLVTANAMTGQINLFTAAGSTSWTRFQVNNSFVNANSTIQISQRYNGSTDAYLAVAQAGAGFFIVAFQSSGTATEAIAFNFTVLSGSNT